MNLKNPKTKTANNFKLKSPPLGSHVSARDICDLNTEIFINWCERLAGEFAAKFDPPLTPPPREKIARVWRHFAGRNNRFIWRVGVGKNDIDAEVRVENYFYNFFQMLRSHCERELYERVYAAYERIDECKKLRGELRAKLRRTAKTLFVATKFANAKAAAARHAFAKFEFDRVTHIAKSAKVCERELVARVAEAARLDGAELDGIGLDGIGVDGMVADGAQSAAVSAVSAVSPVSAGSLAECGFERENLRAFASDYAARLEAAARDYPAQMAAISAEFALRLGALREEALATAAMLGARDAAAVVSAGDDAAENAAAENVSENLDDDEAAVIKRLLAAWGRSNDACNPPANAKRKKPKTKRKKNKTNRRK